jgi:hypothetical protein
MFFQAREPPFVLLGVRSCWPLKVGLLPSILLAVCTMSEGLLPGPPAMEGSSLLLRSS